MTWFTRDTDDGELYPITDPYAALAAGRVVFNVDMNQEQEWLESHPQFEGWQEMGWTTDE